MHQSLFSLAKVLSSEKKARGLAKDITIIRLLDSPSLEFRRWTVNRQTYRTNIHILLGERGLNIYAGIIFGNQVLLRSIEFKNHSIESFRAMCQRRSVRRIAHLLQKRANQRFGCGCLGQCQVEGDIGDAREIGSGTAGVRPQCL